MYIDDPELEKIFGKWEWVQSTGGDNWGIYSPALDGYTQSLVLTKKGKYEFFKNDTLQSKYDYWITKEYDKYRHRYVYLLNHEYFPFSQEIRFGGTDTLYLDERCDDCFWHIYVRKK